MCLYTQEFGVTGTLGALSAPAVEASYRPSPSLARAVHLLRINRTCATTMAPFWAGVLRTPRPGTLTSDRNTLSITRVGSPPPSGVGSPI
jgi:hypothetical protein